MRLAFLGSPPFATPVFAAMLAAELPVVGLVTAPPRRAGRGRRMAENPLLSLAQAHELPVLQPESARDPAFQDAFAAWQADLGVVVSYGQLLNQAMLDLPRQGCLNLHASLLPRWRGASPIQAALLAGDEETGVSLQRMVLALDAGPVVAERRTAIATDEDAPTLFARLAHLGAELVVDFLQSLPEDEPLPAGHPQDESQVTICRKVKKRDGEVDWSAPAAAIERQVRAMAGWPCAHTTFADGTGLKIHRATVAEGSGPAGTVLAAGPELEVACGQGSLRIHELQREGKGRMDAASFLRGAGLRRGDRLGQPS